MLAYLLRRISSMLVTLIVISIVTFVIIQLPPGDYLTTLAAELQARGEGMDNGQLQMLRDTYGLDLPWHLQYLKWMWGILHGDFGWSFAYERPVSEVIGDRLALTMMLSFVTIVTCYLIAFPIGIYSALHPYSWSDYGLTFLGFLGLAVPNFLLALVLLYLANIWFGTTIGGLMDAQYIGQPWSWGKVQSVLAHMAVPVLVIGTAGTAAMIRRLRANMMDELTKPYVTTARAKGMSPLRGTLKYPLRLALNPFIADIGNLLPQIISGGAVVSIVLSLPTTGPMLVEALRSQDMYLAGSFLMFLAVLTVIGVFVSDLLLAALDPRIRLTGGAQR